jgi:hypothetical protein
MHWYFDVVDVTFFVTPLVIASKSVGIRFTYLPAATSLACVVTISVSTFDAPSIVLINDQ